ncbi:50S ribosomal protein L33 [Mycoplasma sp. (ex Biomphalaria glabrata)]|nr:50S ribosomal protein L33 [Mycoplasma sp. (ex Biomphalaria glabrata)]
MKKKQYILICTVCHSRNYQTHTNLKSDVVNKYCKKCEAHTPHKISR